MAIVQLESSAITSIESGSAANGNILDAKIRSFVGLIAITNSDSTGSVLRFGQVPSNARISQLLLYSPDIGTTTAADFGLYQTTANGGAVVDADFFASGVSLSSGALNASDITHESGVFGLDDAEKMLWQALGLSSDPGIMYDIAATLTGDADAGGNVVLKGYYAI